MALYHWIELKPMVRTVEEAGKGALLEQFETLKQKLAAEGLIDDAR